MVMPRPCNAAPLLSLVSARALLLCTAPARAQVILPAFSMDQQIGQSSPTFAVTAHLTQPSSHGDWRVLSGTITIDDVDYPAVIANNSSPDTTLTYTWDSTQESNPSEHSVTASAQVQFEYEGPPSGPVDTISSTMPAFTAGGSLTAFYGDGRKADLVLADVRLKSLQFTGNIALNRDRTTPVATPEFTWDPAAGSLTASNPVAYVQGSSVGFTMALCTSKGYDLNGMAVNGGATMGYALKLMAYPDTTNPATNQPDPPLTLYDNTTASPFAPTAFSDTSTTVAATTSLSSWVSVYGLGFATLDLYVEFSLVTPAPTWGFVGSYVPANSEFGNEMYAVMATPTSPMAPPWVDVLGYACDWAGRTSDATSATTALAKGLYNSGTYNNGQPQDTDATNPETFYLGDFLSGSPNLVGQCNDFADFLFCASSAIGAKSLQVQRIDNSVAGTFTTTSITASHDQTPSDAAPEHWYYHQFAGSNTFFDGCLRLQGTTTPADLALQTYTSSLIAPGFASSAESLFTPTIKNTRSSP